MSQPVYDHVYALAEKLMAAADHSDQGLFDQYYKELEALCKKHEGQKSDHPVLWETLADFTEELEEAISIYEKALLLAVEENAHEYQATIRFSMAKIFLELGKEAATKYAHQAIDDAKKAGDQVLVKEIESWLL